MFSCEFCEIFKNTFFHRTPLVAAFAKIYDKVWYKSLTSKLKSHNIQGEPLTLLEIFFDNFEQRLGQNSEWKSIRSWVPQWSVLGLFLFLISINDMSDIILLICKIFNDDTSLFLEVLHVNESLELNMDLILNPKKQQSFFLGNWIIVRILHLHSITTSISLSSQKTSGCCVRLSKTLKSAAKQ